jgi:hypothetical protein
MPYILGFQPCKEFSQIKYGVTFKMGLSAKKKSNIEAIVSDEGFTV